LKKNGHIITQFKIGENRVVELQLTPESFADNFRFTSNFFSPVNIPSSHETSLSHFTNVSSISDDDVIWAIPRRTSSDGISGLITDMKYVLYRTILKRTLFLY
jgi:hypothetical protein